MAPDVILDPAAPEPVEEPARADAEAAQPVRREARPAPPDAADPGLLTLRVVERGEEAPVADARVRYRFWEEAKQDEGGEAAADKPESGPGDDPDLSSFVDAGGEVRTGAEGRAQLRLPTDSLAEVDGSLRLAVVVEAGSLWGQGRFGSEALEAARRRAANADDEKEPEPLEVRVVTDWALEVRAVDPRGAGVADLALSVTGRKPQERWFRRTTEGWKTDSGGRARIEHASHHVAGGSELEWFVAADGVALEPLRVPFEVDPPPTEPLVLPLPWSGSLEVRVFGPTGEPAGPPTAVQVGIVRPGEEREFSPFRGQRRDYAQESLVDGRAIFELVEIDQELEIRTAGDWGAPVTKRFEDGPRRAGERLSFDLRTGVDHPVVQVRIVDEQGDALVDTDIGLRLTGRMSFSLIDRQLVVRSDEDGQVALAVRSGFKEGDSRLLVASAGDGDEERSARLELSRELEPGLNFLGDLTLAPPPLLVGGIVEDSAGAGVAGAQLEVSYDRSDEGWGWWTQLEVGEVVSAADGSFEIRSALAAKRLRVQARSGTQESATETAEAGEASLRLAIREVGHLEGSVLLPEGAPHDAIQIVFLAGTGSAQQDEAEDLEHDDPPLARLDEEGVFKLRSLQPGPGRVTVRLSHGHRRVASVENLTIVGGETLHDPRLRPLDLRRELFVHRVEFVLPADATGDFHGNAQLREAGEDESEVTHSWFNSQHWVLLTPFATVYAEISVPGYRPVVLEALSGEAQVRLQRGYPVRLRLSTAVELPEPPRYLKAVLTQDDGFNGIDWGSPAFDGSLECVTRAPSAGRLKVAWVWKSAATPEPAPPCRAPSTSNGSKCRTPTWSRSSTWISIRRASGRSTKSSRRTTRLVRRVVDAPCRVESVAS